MVCLSLTLPSLPDWQATVERYRGLYGCVELRVDLLAHAVPAAIARFSEGLDVPSILTIRRAVDGGRYPGSEDERLTLMADLLRAGEFAYVDLEEDLKRTSGGAELAAAAGRSKSIVIRSLHDFAGVPDDIPSTLARLAETEEEIPKLAVTPQGTADLHAILRGYGPARRNYPNGFILLGMGTFGVPTRILSPALGALLTFASAPGAAAAPGHLDPETLQRVYGLDRLRRETRLFAVIGNPVLHSQSPHYHNPRFLRDGFDAAYVPMPTDDVVEFFRLVDTLDIQGFSVTIPHKEAALAYLDDLGAPVDGGSRAAGACNTVVRRGNGFFGTNTDVPGFLGPLERVLPDLRGLSATIIGAGGAARGICYALAGRGVSLLVLNRTVERAERLASDIAEFVEGAQVEAAPLGPSGFLRADRYRDIVVQTTGIGMSPHIEAEPAPDLQLTGAEVVYDIIYTPEETAFLKRAKAAGCRIITGRAMFDGQAAEQYSLFAERLRDIG